MNQEQIEDLVEEAFKVDGLLAKQFPGYIPRPQQIELAQKIQESIKSHTLLVAEAPTGVGKSVGGLIPGLEVVFQEDAPVVVVTSSIVLQEQYYHKDVPTLERVLGRPLQATMIKGRSNYLCELKHTEFKVTGQTTTDGLQERQKILEWAKQTRTGDFSELSFVPKGAVLADFAALDDGECAGKQCPAYSICHYYRERKKVLASKLIICNYHYFFTALNNEKMLPPGVKVVIFDEGHEISAIARDFQERQYTMHAVRNAMRNFLKLGRSYETRDPDQFMEFQGIMMEADLNNLQGSIETMFTHLSIFFKQHKPDAKDTWTMNRSQRQAARHLAEDHYERMCTASKYLLKYCDDNAPDEQDEPSEDELKWFRAIENLFGNLRGKMNFLEHFFGFQNEAPSLFFDESDDEVERPPEPPEDETVIHWIQPYNDDGAVSLHIKPSMAAPLMGGVLDTTENEYTPIILSATLAVGGQFDHLAKDLGITNEYDSLIVGSPFDLNQNLLWYLPKEYKDPDGKMQPVPPGNDRNHWWCAATEMLKVVRKLGGRTLCLFTSIKSMNETAALFRRELPKDIRVLVQNEYPRAKIINMIKANPHTVILGTKSFFTGIDIQGQNLSAVLLDKLPFPMIGDPVNDYLMNRDRGFFTFTLPEAIITLMQAFGRLNRTTSDKGIVAVYDGRLATSGYRAFIFNSFRFQVTATRDWETVCKYIDDIGI